MTQPDTHSKERACEGCPYPRHCLSESCVSEGGIHDEDQRKKVEAEISELKVREQRIREIRQSREGMIRNYQARKFV